MNRTSREVTLCWVKAHVWTLGHELANTLAKKAAANESLTEDYNRIPKSVVTRVCRRRNREEMAKKLDKTHQRKHNERIFPKRRRKFKNENKNHTKFTAIVTGHGKTKAHLHHFKIIEEPTCPCGTAEQTTDHVIFECETLTKEREMLKTTALQKGSWPTKKSI